MTEAWQRKIGQSDKGGLSRRGKEDYNRRHHAHLKAPTKHNNSRHRSFCSRMCGMKKKLTSAKTANDPNSRVNKSLRVWGCRCN